MTGRLQVLVIEEDASDGDRIEEELRRAGYDATCTYVNNEQEYCQCLDPEPDVVLGDNNTSNFDSLRAIEILRKRGAEVPFIVVSRKGNESTALEALRRGAADYVRKDRLSGLGTAIANVLEQKRQRSQKRDDEAQLILEHRAINACTQGVAIIDACQTNYPIIFVNPGFEILTGYRRDEVVGRNHHFLLGLRTDPATAAQLEQALHKGEAVTVEIMNYRRDGTPFWNAVTLSPIRDETGRLTHFASVQTDISERKRIELQYRQAQKMEAIGRLAGGIAHDFNNLLTIILGCSDLALNSTNPESLIREHLQQIKLAGERGANLTRQLLAFSRKQVLETRLLNLNDVINDISKMLLRLIGEDVEYATNLDSKLGMIKADPSQLEQVILNLVVNARDAMPHGGRITIETKNVELDERFVRERPEVTPGAYVLMTIRDTGCGMTPEVMAHMYEPFFTTKEGGRGTGLGLATVYGIVKQSNGYIYADSQPDQGTSFSVYFPRAQSTEIVETRMGNTEMFPKGKETVLLIEDDPNVRKLNTQVLENKGYKVLVAKNGAEAVQVAESHPSTIHMVVTDVVMPGMTCRELTERITMLRPTAKILYVSGYSVDALTTQGIMNAEFCMLQKPFPPFALIRKVRELLKD